MNRLGIDRLQIEIAESDRQAILLALAKLYHTRPGWDYMMERIAGKLDGRELYESFKLHGPDAPHPHNRVAAHETPPAPPAVPEVP